MKKIDLSILITTYMTKDLLHKALDSVISNLKDANFSHEILVIDNNSNDGTVELVKEQYENVSLIVNEQNYGLAYALNQGIKAVSGKYILAMDSDVEVKDGTIIEMYHYLEKNPQVSGVVPFEFKPNKKQTRPRLKVGISLKKPDYSKPFYLEFPGNTFSMISKKAYDDVGLYDEKYIFSVEDLDWAHRAKLKNHKFVLLPQCEIIHYGRQGKYKNYDKMLEELYPTNLYYFKKFYNPLIVFLAYWSIRLGIKFSRYQNRNNQDLVKAYDNALKKVKNEYKNQVKNLA